MPTYVHLMELGQANLEAMEHSPARRQAAKDLVESVGGEVHGIYYTFGRYDVVSVVEYPDAATAARAVIEFRGAGNTKVETLPAFTEEEWDEDVVAHLSE